MSDDLALVAKLLKTMGHNAVLNYATPGLTSRLLGSDDGAKGHVRMFTCDRDTRDWITPHSHRYDFSCLVLSGCVMNMLYRWEAHGDQKLTNAYAVGTIYKREDGLGQYEFEPGVKQEWYSESRAQYTAGDWYHMEASQIHSIEFARNTRVIFFEGPEVALESKVLEPWSEGARVPTFETRDWMFKTRTWRGPPANLQNLARPNSSLTPANRNSETCSSYHSSTDGRIPLSFKGRHLLQDLRFATMRTMEAGEWQPELSEARAALARRMGELEEKVRQLEIQAKVDGDFIDLQAHRLARARDKIEAVAKVVNTVEPYDTRKMDP